VEPVVTRLGSLLLHRDRSSPIRLLHSTLREFLTMQSKAGKYYIRPELGHHTLASGCINIISHQSKQALSNLPKLDGISARQGDSIAMRHLLIIDSGLFVILRRHGYITVQCRTES